MPERFELCERLGRGAMGTVWRARDSQSGRFVALKILDAAIADDPQALARFEREVATIRSIRSPNVVEVFASGRHAGVPCIAMELVDGPTLRDRADGRRMPWAEVSRIAVQLGTALDAVHRAGVIHRDVKPSNVLVARDGTVKLADFGIAHAAAMTRLTRTSAMLGTPAYMAPDDESTAQSDLYSLGCVLYELLTGAPPFAGGTEREMLLRHMREAPRLDRIGDARARSLVGWLLEKDPHQRPPSAAAMVAAVAGLGAGPPAGGPSAYPAGSADGRQATGARRAWPWVAAGVAAVAVAAAGTLAALTQTRDDGEAAEDAIRTSTATGSETRAVSSQPAGAQSGATLRATATPAPVNVSGTWRFRDTITRGPGASSANPVVEFDLSLFQSGSRLSGSSQFFNVVGEVSGSRVQLTMVRTEGSGQFDLALGADGVLRGVYEDFAFQNGGTTVATRR